MANAYSGVATAGDVTALTQAMLDVYSLDILHEAQGIMRYEEFAVMKTELSASPGQTVKFTIYNNLSRGGQLQEHVPMETKSLSASQADVTVHEFGNAIGLTEKLLQLSWDDMLREAAVQLGRDYALTRDLYLRDRLVAGGNVLFTNPSASGVGDVGAGDVFDVETIRNAVEELATANAPKFYGDYYVCFIHPHQAAHLKRDPDWVAAQNYAQTRALFNGEIGRWEDVVFIQTTHQGNGAAGTSDPGYDATLDGTGDGAINLYRATIFSDEAYGLADALPVEMRDGGTVDFGRLHGIAWYAIFGAKILQSQFVQHIISA